MSSQSIEDIDRYMYYVGNTNIVKFRDELYQGHKINDKYLQEKFDQMIKTPSKYWLSLDDEEKEKFYQILVKRYPSESLK